MRERQRTACGSFQAALDSHRCLALQHQRLMALVEVPYCRFPGPRAPVLSARHEATSVSSLWLFAAHNIGILGGVSEDVPRHSNHFVLTPVTWCQQWNLPRPSGGALCPCTVRCTRGQARRRLPWCIRSSYEL